MLTHGNVSINGILGLSLHVCGTPDPCNIPICQFRDKDNKLALKLHFMKCAIDTNMAFQFHETGNCIYGNIFCRH